MKLAQPVGVNRVVLIQVSFYGFDNSYMLDMIEQHPKNFVGVAVIDQDGRRTDVHDEIAQTAGGPRFSYLPQKPKTRKLARR